jgi:hypothetical protein
MSEKLTREDYFRIGVRLGLKLREKRFRRRIRGFYVEGCDDVGSARLVRLTKTRFSDEVKRIVDEMVIRGLSEEEICVALEMASDFSEKILKDFGMIRAR